LLEILKEIAPDVRRMTLMFNPDTVPFYLVFLRQFGAAPASLGVELSASPVHNEAEIEAAITAFAREPRGGLIVAPDAFINTRRHLIMVLAEQHRLPAIYGFRQFVTEGARVSRCQEFVVAASASRFPQAWRSAVYRWPGAGCRGRAAAFGRMLAHPK
jgi:putative ABC transport system substrate-binding protein